MTSSKNLTQRLVKKILLKLNWHQTVKYTISSIALKYSEPTSSPKHLYQSVAVFAHADGYLERHKEITQMVILGVI